MFEKEPTLFIVLNNFVKSTKLSMEEMQFNEDQKAELTSIYMVLTYVGHYETYLENKIIKFFSNILDDYTK